MYTHTVEYLATERMRGLSCTKLKNIGKKQVSHQGVIFLVLLSQKKNPEIVCTYGWFCLHKDIGRTHSNCKQG